MVGTDQADRIQTHHVQHVDIRNIASGQKHRLGSIFRYQQHATRHVQLSQLGDHRGGLWRLDAKALDDLQAILTNQLGKDRADRNAVSLAVDLLLVAARLGCKGATTTDKDRRTVITVTGAAALLLLELLGGTGHLAARQLRLGTGTAGRLIGDNDLVNKGLLVLTAEHLVRHGKCLLGRR